MQKHHYFLTLGVLLAFTAIAVPFLSDAQTAIPPPPGGLSDTKAQQQVPSGAQLVYIGGHKVTYDATIKGSVETGTPQVKYRCMPSRTMPSAVLGASIKNHQDKADMGIYKNGVEIGKILTPNAYVWQTQSARFGYVYIDKVGGVNPCASGTTAPAPTPTPPQPAPLPVPPMPTPTPAPVPPSTTPEAECTARGWFWSNNRCNSPIVLPGVPTSPAPTTPIPTPAPGGTTQPTTPVVQCQNGLILNPVTNSCMTAEQLNQWQQQQTGGTCPSGHTWNGTFCVPNQPQTPTPNPTPAPTPTPTPPSGGTTGDFPPVIIPPSTSQVTEAAQPGYCKYFTRERDGQIRKVKISEKSRENLAKVMKLMYDKKTLAWPEDNVCSADFLTGDFTMQLLAAISGVGCGSATEFRGIAGCRTNLRNRGIISATVNADKRLTRLEFYDYLLRAREILPQATDVTLKDLCGDVSDELNASPEATSIFVTALTNGIASVYGGNNCRLENNFYKYEAAKFALRALEAKTDEVE